MASYQDIESRLGVVERKLDFLMKTFKLTKTIPTGMLDEKGRSIMRQEVATMLDVYREVAAGQIELIEETANGTNG